MNPDVGRPGEAKPLLLQVIGLQRAGNHAIIDWLMSLFERPVHLNNLPHDFLDRPEALDTPAVARADCCILSFEDALIKFGRTEAGESRRLVDSVTLAEPARLPGFDIRVLYVLRDPYNCWASRVKARETSGLTAPAELAHFLGNWLAMAERYAGDQDAFILYNAWFRSQAYRRQVCARLGGRYSERTLGDVPLEGRGSSFDGAGRPSVRTMWKRIDYYRSGAFRRRLLREPGAYLGRLFAPRLDARQLQVDSRWQLLVGRDDAGALFENPEVAALSREIFGFHVDAAGRMHPAAGRRQAG
jgi:hypothetical protein